MRWGTLFRLPRDRRSVVIALVLGRCVIFFMIPFFLVLKISLSRLSDMIPPYAPMFTFDGMRLAITLTFENFSQLLSDPIFVLSYLGSLQTAAITTIFCILLGYPLAYAVAAARPSARPSLLLLMTIPFWTSFLIRIYAWIGILKDNGLLNNLLIWLGVIAHPLRIMNTSTSIYIGMVYCYLPFFVLPLRRTEDGLVAAGSREDLGWRPFRAFWAITVPLSLPGVAAGALLVFVPATGEYLIPRILAARSI